jgi:hypothetical protein
MLQFWIRNALNSQCSGRSSFLGAWKPLNGDGCSCCLVNLGRFFIELLLVVVAEENGDGGFLLWGRENLENMTSRRGLIISILFRCGGYVMLCLLLGLRFMTFLFVVCGGVGRRLHHHPDTRKNKLIMFSSVLVCSHAPEFSYVRYDLLCSFCTETSSFD